MNTIKLKTKEKLFPTGDLYGIFFEDLNHAADGGLYPEMVQNRSFEFCADDNPEYTPLTAWEKRGGGEISVMCGGAVSEKNPHYLVIKSDGTTAVINRGFNSGMVYEKGERYNYFIYAKSDDAKEIELSFESADGRVYASESVSITAQWQKYEGSFTADETEYSARAAIKVNSKCTVMVDMFSVMPQKTFKNHGLRCDIGEMLADLRPKFMRFPGGCLVHDGAFDKNSRTALYRWTNTIGDITERPARRNNWGYNQTAGLGFYEYFVFCEDIGAKPVPILSGAWNPHSHTGVPIEELGEWVDEALALIEFANGDESTKWGALRCSMGHKEPFGLEYVGIGNEEVAGGFFERYPYFHKAIREKYPDIKIIGTSGPFADGTDFETGWGEARKWGTDIVDEHYYMHPSWFMANIDRYKYYDRTGPKVFLGEYASWGNKFKNAIAEACYMTELENNADVVSLACYAPLLSNNDYVNWEPDMIWFDNHRIFGTVNYYTQKMFMNNQPEYVIASKHNSELSDIRIENQTIGGRVGFSTSRSTAEFYDIRVNGDKITQAHKTNRGSWNCDNGVFSQTDGEVVAAEMFLECKCCNDTVYSLKAKKKSGREGFRIVFGADDNGEYYFWEIGGWNNDVSSINRMLDGKSACITVGSNITIESEREYEISITVRGNHITCRLDGKLMHDFEELTTKIRPLYYTAGVSGDETVLKAVNYRDTDYETVISLDTEVSEVVITELKSDNPEAKNSFDNPTAVTPETKIKAVSGREFQYTFPKNSITVLTIK